MTPSLRSWFGTASTVRGGVCRCAAAQIRILESALHLHGQLAPAGVQPLHRRLQERFAQLRQGLRDLSLAPRARGKSQSDSIVNTPLPPLPVEKKQSLMHCSGETPSNRSSASGSSAHYGHLVAGEDQGTDDEDIYSRPMELLERMNGSAAEGTCDHGSVHPPPIPLRESRPRSAGFSAPELVRTPTRGTIDYSSLPPMRCSRDGPGDGEAGQPRPPKQTHQRSLSKPISFPTNPSSAAGHGSGDANCSQLRNSWSETSAEEAPPLPPRGQTPDRRNTAFFFETSQTPPAPPKRLVKKGSGSTVYGADSLVDSSLELEQLTDAGDHDLRDSGYSEFSMSLSQTTPNNFNNLSYEEFDLAQRRSDVMNISPPPIPPKSTPTPAPGSPSGTLERCPVENYSVPKLQKQPGSPS